MRTGDDAVNGWVVLGAYPELNGYNDQLAKKVTLMFGVVRSSRPFGKTSASLRRKSHENQRQ